MKILALEFSSPQRSVAVIQAGPDAAHVCPSEVIQSGPESANALEMIAECLREAKIDREQIECLAIGLGPGSYNGIRAAIALAQGWQLAAGERELKLLGISSAECVAAEAQTEGLSGRVDIVIDAQRNEFYLAGYLINAAGREEIDPLRLAALAEVQAREQAGGIIAGPEAAKWFPAGRVIFPRAATLGQLAMGRNGFVAAEKLEPIYLRETSFVKAPPSRSFP
ncbi:MAG: tRNA threonylcarbamoyladenosine biosynthesis protein TsaB [Verrucomicrobiota bacterium]